MYTVDQKTNVQLKSGATNSFCNISQAILTVEENYFFSILGTSGQWSLHQSPLSSLCILFSSEKVTPSLNTVENQDCNGETMLICAWMLAQNT